MNAGGEPVTKGRFRLNDDANGHGRQRQGAEMTGLEPHRVFLCRQHYAGSGRARPSGDAIDVEVGERMMIAKHDGASHLPAGGRDISKKSLRTRHGRHREYLVSARNG